MSECDLSKIIPKLESIVQHHGVMKKSYFWSPPSNANNRRKYEEDNSDSFIFIYNNDSIEIIQRVSCSCNNIYYSLHIYKNNMPTSHTIKFIKDIINTQLPNSIKVSSPNWKYNYEQHKITLLKSNMTIDCGKQDQIHLITPNNTTIINPGYDCTIQRKDIKESKQFKLIPGITHLTNVKGTPGFLNNDEILAHIFENTI